MPDTATDARRLGETVTSRFNETVDQVSSAAADASAALRQQGARLASNAQDLYEELEGDDAAAKLRNVVSDYPIASLLVAGAAGFLIARFLRD